MKKVLLILILLLAFVLRFYRLDSYPALNADEAAIGYNAYSLIETGRDEHGNVWPIHFQSFNDYKPGLYFYLVLPLVYFLGLNEWAVRIPGAFLGVGTVFLVYLLVKELSLDQRKFSIFQRKVPSSAYFQFSTSEIAAFFLAISPWHIHFSRGGWEVNVATFFIVLGVLLFITAFKKTPGFQPGDELNSDMSSSFRGNPALKSGEDVIKSLTKPKYYVLCALSFVLSLYTYHATRVLVPLLGLGILVIYRSEITKNLKGFLVAGLVGMVLIIPLVKDMVSGGVLSRVTGVGIFADSGTLSRINEQRGEHGNLASLSARFLHNKAVNYGLTFFENWSKHFHGEFLFLSGDTIERNRVPETGQLYFFDFLFLVVGLWAIFKNPKGWGLIILWLVIAPTAAALTFQSPHALRAQNMVIPITIISAYGFVTSLSKLNELRVTRFVFGKFSIWHLIFGIIILWSFSRYLHMYYIHMAKEYPFSSQYGVKELVNYVSESQDKYKEVIVTDRYDQPYILFLFYLKYPPERFQGNHSLTPRDEFGFSTVDRFDRYEFHPIDFKKIQSENSKSLIVGTDEEIPENANVIEKIYGLNGHLYFEVVEN